MPLYCSTKRNRFVLMVIGPVTSTTFCGSRCLDPVFMSKVIIDTAALVQEPAR